VTDPIRVLIADDQTLLRDSFRVLLDTTPGLTVVGEAGTGREAVQLALAQRPDVVLMDHPHARHNRYRGNRRR
jgi:DNA-binding NarL/FixJ family response regulator